MAPYRVLIVDDEKVIRDTRALLLRASGYEVSLAKDGFDALLQLRYPPHPHLIISDLNMPNMSGFEFLSVLRRRFPEIAVIASSGAYHSGTVVPGGIIADAFHTKGSPPPELLATVSNLLAMSEDSIIQRHTGSAPVWIPRNGRDSKGVPFIVVTCPDCLRSFPLSVTQENLQEVQETECLFCPTRVRYIIDFSPDVISPKTVRQPTNRPGATFTGSGRSQSPVSDDRGSSYRLASPDKKTAAFGE
jgi:CheY-like chemotaxis protein